jgi:predicted transcriptional regulator
MAETGQLTIRLPKEYLEQLDTLAASTGRSKSALAGEALAVYLAAQEWQVTAIEEGVRAANAGAKPVEHAAVTAWLRSWGTDHELPRPE